MNARWAFLFVLLAGPLASGAEEMLTLTGETYTNVVVLRYDRRGYFIRHDGGDVKIPYKVVLPELREYYKKLASYLTPEQKGVDEKEEPPGPNDLATRAGRVYRDVVVKKIDAYAVYFQHDGGSATPKTWFCASNLLSARRTASSSFWRFFSSASSRWYFAAALGS